MAMKSVGGSDEYQNVQDVLGMIEDDVRASTWWCDIVSTEERREDTGCSPTTAPWSDERQELKGKYTSK